jgi:hypothetical protein
MRIKHREESFQHLTLTFDIYVPKSYTLYILYIVYYRLGVRDCCQAVKEENKINYNLK